MAGNFPNLMETINPYIKEIQYILSTGNDENYTKAHNQVVKSFQTFSSIFCESETALKTKVTKKNNNQKKSYFGKPKTKTCQGKKTRHYI